MLLSALSHCFGGKEGWEQWEFLITSLDQEQHQEVVWSFFCVHSWSLAVFLQMYFIFVIHGFLGKKKNKLFLKAFFPKEKLLL